jgi:hypothetical protein
MEAVISRRTFIAGVPVVAAAAAFPGASSALAAEAESFGEGNYYFAVAPDDGTPLDRSGGLIPFSHGALFDRDVTGVVGWRGGASAPKTVSMVFDLLNDYPLDQLKLLSAAPNEFWGFDEITVTYRPEASATYRIAARATRSRTELDYQLTVPMSGTTARFLRIELFRNNQWLHIPLNEIQLVLGQGEPGQNPAPALTVDGMRQELSRYTRLVDRYGQYLYQTWPGKVTSDAQLREEAAQEEARLAGVELDLSTYDRYGGLRRLGTHGATGYFRLEKVDGRWWFVTPEGHLFFLKAVDALSEEEWGYGTLYQNADGSLRDVFDELPDPRRFASAYAVVENGLHTVNFLKANLMRKYGDDYKAKWRDITRRRMVDWGFNAQGKWHRDPAVVMPYIERAPTPPDAVKVLWGIDPFDPEFSAKLDRAFTAFGLAKFRNDPWLIGYFFENERGWNRDVVAAALRLDSSLAAKQAFTRYLAETYGDDLARVNDMLGTDAPSFRALADVVIDVDRVPDRDVKAFITQASRTYYRKVRDAIQRHDPHHLFLGSCLVPTWRTSPEWNVGGVDYLDAISFDWYSDNADYLRQYGVHDKPIINLEFSFCHPERGLTSHNPTITATSIANRGEKFRDFVRAQAASPVFVGSAWFVHYDQAVTRKPGSTEAFNMGLINQQDQPYHDMTDIMRETNRDLESVHLRRTWS